MSSAENLSIFHTIEERKDNPRIFEWTNDISQCNYEQSEIIYEGILAVISFNKLKAHKYILTLQFLIKHKVRLG